MTEIYIVRHTQAEGNLFRMMQGHWDGDVTQTGLSQIDALEKRFKNIHLDAVYSSDLYRAKITAGALLKSNGTPELIPDKQFREIDVGPWETRFFGNVIHDYPEESHYFMYDSEKWNIDGAETFADVKKRATEELANICLANSGKTIAVVSHGVTIRSLISEIFSIPLTDITRNPICGNTAVSKLRFSDGEYTAEYLNNTSHLSTLGIKKWSSTRDLRDIAFDPKKDSAFYSDCYKAAWEFAHGRSPYFNPEPYLKSAIGHAAAYAGAVRKLYDGDIPAGLLDMDTKRGAEDGYGWISLLYLLPEYRFKGYGIQVLARAIQEYRKLGRDRLRLSVNEDNSSAIAFYTRQGFKVIAEEPRITGMLLILEKNIRERIRKE